MEHTEPLNGGLVTNRDASLLNPGELQLCTNAIYTPNSPSLSRAPGHSLFGTVSASAQINGLVNIKFDNGNHYLIAETSAGLRSRAPVGSTGTFTTAASGITTGSWLDAIHFQNRYFLLNGANPNTVALLSATAVANVPQFRTHGLIPVSEPPGVVTGAGTWSQVTTGWFEYWTTEVVTGMQDGAQYELESTFGPTPNSTADIKPASIQVSSTNIVLINRPQNVNPGAARWKVYRSPKKETDKEQMFPDGFLVADVPFDITTINDGSANTASATATGFQNVGGFSNWSGNATSLNTSNNVYVSATGTGTALESYGLLAKVGTFTSTIVAPILGLEVMLEAKRNANFSTCFIKARLTKDNGTTYTPYKTFAVGTAEAVATVGGPNDLWGTTWSAADVTGTNFGVFLLGGFNTSTDVLQMDQMRVRVTYGGTSATDVEPIPFPAVEIEVGGERTGIGSHGQPPTASTGDLFEDCLVTNDISNPSFVRWSLGGEPEYFPEIYFNDFETLVHDVVTCIKSLGNRLIVGCKNAIFRMNYLPNEDDARFNRGKALDIISLDRGIVNPKAACTFTDGDGRTALAFVDSTGVFITDGFTYREAAPDIIWTTVFSGLSVYTGGIVELKNDPAKWELRLTLANSSIGTKVYRLHYHPSHMKGQYMKVSGPQFINHDAVGTRSRVSDVVPRSDGTWTVYLGYMGTGTGGGAVYRETGTNMPVTNDGTFTASVKTRDMYLAGFGNEFKTSELYIHHQAFGSTALQFGLNTHIVGEAETIGATDTITTSFTGFSKLDTNTLSDALAITIADDTGNPSTISNWKLDYLVLRGEDFGREET